MVNIHENEKEAWSQWLNCSIEDFSKKGVIYCANSQLNNKNWIYILALEYSIIISMPSERVEYYRNRLEELNNKPLVGIADVLNLLLTDIEVVRPILYQSFASTSTINIGGKDSDAVLLPAMEMKLLKELKEACPADEWSHSGLSEDDSKNIFAVCKNNTILAAAHYSRCPGNLASVGVLTHPQQRGKGHALNVVSLAAKDAMENDLLVHYQTKIENQSSIAVANKLGCRQFGYSITLEMK